MIDEDIIIQRNKLNQEIARVWKSPLITIKPDAWIPSREYNRLVESYAFWNLGFDDFNKKRDALINVLNTEVSKIDAQISSEEICEYFDVYISEIEKLAKKLIPKLTDCKDKLQKLYNYYIDRQKQIENEKQKAKYETQNALSHLSYMCSCLENMYNNPAYIFFSQETIDQDDIQLEFYKKQAQVNGIRIPVALSELSLNLDFDSWLYVITSGAYSGEASQREKLLKNLNIDKNKIEILRKLINLNCFISSFSDDSFSTKDFLLYYEYVLKIMDYINQNINEFIEKQIPDETENVNKYGSLIKACENYISDIKENIALGKEQRDLSIGNNRFTDKIPLIYDFHGICSKAEGWMLNNQKYLKRVKDTTPNNSTCC